MPQLLTLLEGAELVPFCPEHYAFGTPRPTMDLIQTHQGVRAHSNRTGADFSLPIWKYAERFFDLHPDLDLFIGKDRSPSCGVRTAKVYDTTHRLMHDHGTGLMAQRALKHTMSCWDAEHYTAHRMEEHGPANDGEDS